MINLKIIEFLNQNIWKTKSVSESDRNKSLTGFDLCKIAGVINDKSLTARFHIIRFILVHILSMLHFGLLIAFDYDKIDFLTVVQSFHYIMIHVNGITMGIALVFESKKFTTFCSIIENEFQHTEINLLPEQLEVVKKTNDFIISFIKTASILLVWGFFSASLRRPLFDRTTHMTTPHEGWVPFEINSWFRYIVVWIFQLAIAGNLALGHISTLLAYVMHAKHLCCQCEILSIYIKDTFETRHTINGKQLDESNNAARETLIESKMKYIIQQHHIMLRCYELFQKTYSIVLFAVSLTCGLVVCTVIYTITDPNTTPSLIAEFIGLIIPEMIFILCYCWLGQEVTDSWNSVASSVYNVPWYNESIRTQKSLLNMLTGSVRERTMMGCGIQEFSMKGFSELLQASFSCFNMLNAVR